MRFWRHVLFADEVGVELHPDDTRRRVRRPRNTRYSPRYTVPTYKFGSGKLIFWGAISWEGVGVLHLVTETLNGDRYAKLLGDVIPETLEILNMRRPHFLEEMPLAIGVK